MQVILRMMSTRKRMSEVVIEKRDYMLFDKYELNTDKVITRYECNSSVPLRISKRTADMRMCKCGGELVPLAYVFDNGIIRSRTLLGRKCPYCGHNYFTLKTIALCEEAFLIVDFSDDKEGLRKKSDNDIHNVSRGDIYFADLTGIENYCGSEQTGWRPVLVIQNDVNNHYSNTTIIATITSRDKNRQPTHVKLCKGILEKDSIVCLEQIKTIDKKRLGKFVCNIEDSMMKQIDRAIHRSLELS